MAVILLVADKRHWRPQLMACLYPCPLPWESAAPPRSSNPGWPMTCFGHQTADGTVSQFPTSRNLTGFLCSFLEPSLHRRNKASLLEAERPHGTELNCLSQGHPKPADPETCARAQQDQQRCTLPHTDHRYLSEPSRDQKLLSWHVNSQTIKKRLIIV